MQILPDWATHAYREMLAMEKRPWLQTARETHWKDFQCHGFPTKKHEQWKYTDLSALTQLNFELPKNKHALTSTKIIEILKDIEVDCSTSPVCVLVNGEFIPELSYLQALPKEIVVCSTKEALVSHEELIKSMLQTESALQADKFPLAVLNAASFNHGIFIHVPAAIEMDAPLYLLSIVSDHSDLLIQPRHFVFLSERARISVVEEQVSAQTELSSYFLNQLTHVVLQKDSTFDYYKNQLEKVNAHHVTSMFVNQASSSRSSFTNISLGAKFSRDELTVSLSGEYATCQAAGFYRGDEIQNYVDHHLTFNHLAKHTQSEMLYKGLVDASARVVFNGRVFVASGAQKITAEQANHHVLLSSRAEAYSKPELEIYADDVKCKHGSSSGQLDEEALFYLRSRGLTDEDARALLYHGFAQEVLQRIKIDSLHTRLQEMLLCK